MLRAVVHAGGCVVADNPHPEPGPEIADLEGPFPPGSLAEPQPAVPAGGAATEPLPSREELEVREREARARLERLIEVADRTPATNVWAAARRELLKACINF